MRTSRYVALLGSVNVGGNRKLPMAELRALCERLGMPATVRNWRTVTTLTDMSA
jgi:uncharacterized protein (DUF1697 family)